MWEFEKKLGLGRAERVRISRAVPFHERKLAGSAAVGPVVYRVDDEHGEEAAEQVRDEDEEEERVDEAHDGPR